MAEVAESDAQVSESQENVHRFKDCDQQALLDLVKKLGMQVRIVDSGVEIPGSFRGDDEAGLINDVLYLRADTPVHSALHETCHFVCMDEKRRASLHTNAGGDADEENAVCYLQILLSDALPDMDQQKIFADMDAWGYSFRLGSAQAWFENDADDARHWLESRGLLKVAEQLVC